MGASDYWYDKSMEEEQRRQAFIKLERLQRENISMREALDLIATADSFVSRNRLMSLARETLRKVQHEGS
jgi:hypothetical protein